MLIKFLNSSTESKAMESFLLEILFQYIPTALDNCLNLTKHMLLTPEPQLYFFFLMEKAKYCDCTIDFKDLFPYSENDFFEFAFLCIWHSKTHLRDFFEILIRRKEMISLCLNEKEFTTLKYLIYVADSHLLERTRLLNFLPLPALNDLYLIENFIFILHRIFLLIRASNILIFESFPSNFIIKQAFKLASTLNSPKFKA